MNRIFKFTAHTIDGKIQEFPQQFQLRCDFIKPLGNEIVRQYNGSECIQAMKVFLIYYEGQVLGNKCYTSHSGFIQELRAICHGFGNLQVNGCDLRLNDCNLILN